MTSLLKRAWRQDALLCVMAPVLCVAMVFTGWALYAVLIGN